MEKKQISLNLNTADIELIDNLKTAMRKSTKQKITRNDVVAMLCNSVRLSYQTVMQCKGGEIQ